MRTGTKTMLYLMVLAFFDTVIPVPITAMILLYVLVEKPDWFKKLVADVYAS
jgi:hypothetical protein